MCIGSAYKIDAGSRFGLFHLLDGRASDIARKDILHTCQDLGGVPL